MAEILAASCATSGVPVLNGSTRHMSTQEPITGTHGCGSPAHGQLIQHMVCQHIRLLCSRMTEEEQTYSQVHAEVPGVMNRPSHSCAVLDNATCRHKRHRLFAFDLQEGKSQRPLPITNDRQSVQDSSPLAETSESWTHSSRNGSSVGLGTQLDPPAIAFMS